jgi:membrane-associated phospholipid phosphatase
MNFRFTKIFYNMPKNLCRSIARSYGAYFIISVLATYIMIITGIDWAFNRFTYNNPVLTYVGIPSIFIGAVTPILVPLGMYITGLRKKDPRMQLGGLAIGQSEILIMVFNTIVKAVSGRASPGLVTMFGHVRHGLTEDYSTLFAWGWIEGDRVIGWPSGHVSFTVIAAVIIAMILPEKKWARRISVFYAVYMAAGISLSVHWLSEVIAGVLIGYAIGKTVGERFLLLS